MIFVALMMHGVRPGPLLLTEHPDIFWGVIASMYIGNVLLLGLNLPLIGFWVRLLKVPYRYLAAIVVAVCVIGAYSVNNAAWDVGMMVFFGVMGYVLRKFAFPASPFILAMILGPMLEKTLQQSLIGSGGSFMTFVDRPIAAALLMAAGLLMLTPAAKQLWKRYRILVLTAMKCPATERQVIQQRKPDPDITPTKTGNQ